MPAFLSSVANEDYHVYRPVVFRTPLGHVRLYSKPGIFSWSRLDRGAELILRALSMEGLPTSARVLDLGCGNGIIGFSLLSLQPELDLHLADSSYVAHTAVGLSTKRLGLPAHAWLSDVTADLPEEQKFDVIVTNLPRGRLLAEQFLREAWHRLEYGGRLYVAGAQHVGIRTRVQTMKEWFGNAEVLQAVPRCRVARAVKRLGSAPPPADEYHRWRVATFEARGRLWRYVTKPGVFSWEHLDEGGRRLLENMQVRDGERFLDLGCAAGQVGLVAAHLAQGVKVVMLDDSLVAVRAAQRTAELNELSAITVSLSDSASAVIGDRFDVVATNPPFHRGPSVDYDVAHQFIRDARDVLDAKGRLYLVSNAFIPYARQLEGMFRRVEEVYCDQHYRVLLGARPVGRNKKRAKPPLVADES